MAGQQFEYAFDEIGNRLSTRAGGDAAGGNLRFADYDVNALNQYERRDVPAAIDVIGAAPVASTVKVNSNNAERRGAYYRKELAVNNSSSPDWKVVNVDVDPQNSVDKTGKVFVPQSPEVFTHDADGSPREIYERAILLRLCLDEFEGWTALHGLHQRLAAEVQPASGRKGDFYSESATARTRVLRGLPISKRRHCARCNCRRIAALV